MGMLGGVARQNKAKESRWRPFRSDREVINTKWPVFELRTQYLNEKEGNLFHTANFKSSLSQIFRRLFGLFSHECLSEKVRSLYSAYFAVLYYLHIRFHRRSGFSAKAIATRRYGVLHRKKNLFLYIWLPHIAFFAFSQTGKRIERSHYLMARWKHWKHLWIGKEKWGIVMPTEMLESYLYISPKTLRHRYKASCYFCKVMKKILTAF